MSQLQEAVNTLRLGECVAYPTEGVWGLGCDPYNSLALLNLKKLKQRDDNKGYILLASSLEQLEDFVDISANRERLMTKWPGPHTWIVKLKRGAKAINLGINNTIAVRVSNHQTIEMLCTLFGGAIVSTSANLQGNKPAMTLAEVKEIFPEVFVLEGELGGIAKSTPVQYLDTGVWVRR